LTLKAAILKDLGREFYVVGLETLDVNLLKFLTWS